MPGKTDIEWTDFSSNPLKLRLRSTGKLVNACIPISPGCKNCYAGRMTGRWWEKEAPGYPGYGVKLLKLGKWELNEAEIHKMLTFRPTGPFKNGKRPMVFVCDMTDVFGDWVPDELIDTLFAVFALRPDVDWQVLTKRADRMARYAEDLTFERLRDRMNRSTDGGEHRIGGYNLTSLAVRALRGTDHEFRRTKSPPLPNVWLGVSVENQKAADQRIPYLLKCPAAVRFLSIEPLLGPVDLSRITLHRPKRQPTERHVLASMRDWASAQGIPSLIETDDGRGPLEPIGDRIPYLDVLDGHYINEMGLSFSMKERIHWAIIGGESGAGARFCNLDLVRSLIRQCKSAPIPSFVKQLGAKPLTTVREASGGEDPDDDNLDDLDLEDRKGGDWDEWPEDLRVRQFPKVTVSA